MVQQIRYQTVSQVRSRRFASCAVGGLLPALVALFAVFVADAAHGSDTESFPQRWRTPYGQAAFDAALDRLTRIDPDTLLTPAIWESGPRLPAVPVGGGINRLRLDMAAEIAIDSGWLPGQLPAAAVPANSLVTVDDTRLRWRQTTGLFARLARGWSVYQRAVIDSEPSGDPTRRAPQYRQIDAAIEIPTAVIQYENGPVTAHFGRRWRRWGPGWGGSLLLDAAHATGDGVDLAYNRPRWSARCCVERLDDQLQPPAPADGISGDSAADTRGTVFARYLSAHRLDIAVGDRLRIGFAETVLLATPGNPPLWALNPLLPWVLTQQERGAGDFVMNGFWSGDVTWQPAAGWSCYGQFLLDDYMIDLEDRDTYPDQLGWLAGIVRRSGETGPAASVLPAVTEYEGRDRGSRPLTAVLAGVEYSRLHTWTYIHRSALVRYRAWGAPLGHPAGPDSETVTGFVEIRRPAAPQRLLCWGHWRRHGRIDLDTGESSVGQTDGGFPSAPVRRTVQAGLTVVCSGPRGSRGELRIGWSHRSGQQSSGDGADDFWMSVSVTVPLFAWWATL